LSDKVQLKQAIYETSACAAGAGLHHAVRHLTEALIREPLDKLLSTFA
jgi:hypothetical protein